MNRAENERIFSKEKDPVFKMVVFDMEGVLINPSGSSTWGVVFDKLGIIDEHKRLRERFKSGEFSGYMNWSDEACKVLKAYGLTRGKFAEIIDSQQLITGVREAIQDLREQGYKTAIITGSFTALAQRIQKELGINDAIAHCDLKFDNQGKLDSWELFRVDFGGKVDALSQIASKYNIAPSESIFVGDGLNDIPVFRKAGYSIAFNYIVQDVGDAANAQVKGNDLRLILPIIKNAASKN